MSSQKYSLLAQIEAFLSPSVKWKGRPFLKECKKGDTLQDYHLVDIRHEKVSPFMKFEIILPPLLCFLLDPLTKKHCRTWSSMINLWMDSRTWFNYNYLDLSEENVFRNMRLSHLSCFKVLENSSWYGFRKFLNQFLKQLSCPRRLKKNWRKLPNLTDFSVKHA